MNIKTLSCNIRVYHQGPGSTGSAAGYESLAWVPNSFHIDHGERDAVLVDTFLTTEASQLCDGLPRAAKI